MDNEKKTYVAIIVALIGALALIAVPIINRWLDINFPTSTQIPITKAPAEIQPAQPNENVFTQSFDGSDGSFDTNVWVCSAGNCNAQNVFQRNGTLAFKFNTLEISTETWGANLKSKATWKMGNIISLEGRLQIGANSKGGTWLGLDKSSTCALFTKPDIDALSFDCNLSSDGETEFTTPDLQVEFDKWYTIRIDYDPITQEQKYYLDDKFLGQHTPKNPPDLTLVSLGAWRQDNLSATTFIDNIVVKSRP